MRRSYYNNRRYRRYAKPVKYSAETTCNEFNLVSKSDALANFKVSLIPAIDAQGMRKVKNMKLSITSQPTSKQNIFFVLVYVPQGTAPSDIGIGTDTTPMSMYEPNQNVILQGIISGEQCFIERSTRLARNLNSGDQIALVCSTSAKVAETIPMTVTLNYSITY